MCYQYRLLTTLGTLDWRALSVGDVRSSLEGVAVTCQLALTGGTPLLLVLQMLSRSKPASRVMNSPINNLLRVWTARQLSDILGSRIVLDPKAESALQRKGR